MLKKIVRYLHSHWRMLEITNAPPYETTGVSQVSLIIAYKQALAEYKNCPFTFADIGYKIYSQHEEDGILIYIFSIISTKSRKCVEICAGDGIECNTANLLVNHKWTGLLIDGNSVNVKRGQQFYKRHPNTRYWTPTFACKWLTADNVNDTISSYGFTGEIDLFSLDIDGIDYWIWKSLTVISPRVVVLEINHLWGATKSVTIPYSSAFRAEYTKDGSDYAGASLPAFVKLGKEKGYRLVGTNAFATNAFFVRNDIEHAWLPEVTAEDCFKHPRALYGINMRLPKVLSKIWESV